VYRECGEPDQAQRQGHYCGGRGERAGRIGDGEGGYPALRYRDGADEGTNQPEPAAAHGAAMAGHVPVAYREDADYQADQGDHRQNVQQRQLSVP